MQHFKVIALNLVIALALLTTSQAHADAKRFGLGVILFGPTGISANYFLNSKNSIDGAISWSLNDDEQNLYIHSTYLWHKFGTFENVRFRWYFGGGGRLISWDDPPGKDRDPETRIGGRAAVGIAHMFKDPRIELFAELSLTLDVIPSTDVDLNAGLGARYYF